MKCALCGCREATLGMILCKYCRDEGDAQVAADQRKRKIDAAWADAERVLNEGGFTFDQELALRRMLINLRGAIENE